MSAKREQLLQTADRLFYHEGFYATGIDRVIAEAGVARMTLYKHFPSKDELVLAVLAYREQRYWNTLDKVLSAAKLQNERTIDATVTAHMQWLIDEGSNGCLFFKALGEYASHSARIAEFAIDHKHRFLTLIRESIQDDGLPVDHLAEPIVLLLEGATAYAQILPPVQVAEQVRKTIDILIRSVEGKNGVGYES